MGRVEEHSRQWGFSAESCRHSGGVSVARAERGKKGRVAEEVVVGSRAFLPCVRTWTLSSDSGGARKVFSRERGTRLDSDP